MTRDTASQTTLEQKVKSAKVKLGLVQDVDLRKYLPWNDGHQMHHFSFKKLSKEAPAELSALIERYILAVAAPQPMPSAPRSRRNSGNLNLSRGEIQRLITRLQNVGEEALLIEKLSSQIDSYASIKRELISSIRKDEANEVLFKKFAQKLATRRSQF
ncbi:MAG: hypothetical protein JSR80_04300 [Verrucomicrobia bacterium]|nr:hypothetical protein [Verrucomicrobiota bacterium]